MCEHTRPGVLSEVVSAVGLVLTTRAGRVALTAAPLAVGTWLWPLYVGVGAGVLALVAAAGYVLGAARERPLPITVTRSTPEPDPDTARVAELERQVRESQALAHSAAAALERARDRGLIDLTHGRPRTLPGHLDREGEG